MHGGIKRNECDMELLMTPAEVVEAAFGGGDVIDAAIVTESAVLTAQRRYLRPVFGVSFYGALEQEGTVPSLRSMYGLRSPCSSSTSCCPMRLSGSAGSASCVSAANISSRRTVPH